MKMVRCFNMKNKYALVLAGGGTKGAYQIGALKALKELGVEIEAISGASIGAINGAIIAQGDLDRLEDLYNHIKLEDILELSDKNKIESNEDIFSAKNMYKIMREIIKEKGISNIALRKTLDKYLDVNKLYKSKIDFGLVTFDMENKNGIELFKNDIKKEEMIDYLLASAAFPIFKPQEIKDTKYLDGGISDNMPISLLLKKGYDNIIVIDISGMGRIKRNVYKGGSFKIIKPREDLGSTFDFNHDNISKNIKLGYLDTMKSFHKLVGNDYYFNREEFNKFFDSFTLKEFMGLEDAARYYGLDKYEEYDYEEFINLLYDYYMKDRKKFNDAKTDFKNLNNIKSLSKTTLIFPLIEHITNNYPSLLKTYDGIFSDYINAYEALMVLCELKK